MGLPNPMGDEAGSGGSWWPVIAWLIPVVVSGIGAYWVSRQKAKQDERARQIELAAQQAKSESELSIRELQQNIEQQKLTFETLSKQLNTEITESRLLRNELKEARIELNKAHQEMATERASFSTENAELKARIETLQSRVRELERQLNKQQR